MGVSRESIESLRQALDPLEIIREAVPDLKQSGARWRAPCPFHQEKTPSFFFMPEKGLWHCFGGCQEGGDIFKFMMKLENISFSEALQQLAQRAGVTLDWDQSREVDSAQAQERDRLLELLESATVYYHEVLKQQADGETARRYLAQRGIRPNTIDTFRLGAAPMQGGFFEQSLKKGTPIELLLKAGLVVRSQSSRYLDPLRGRVVFPVMDPYGNVIAFGGRTLSSEDLGPKYLNSPETPVFTKGKNLFGLFQGRTELRSRNQILVVEGYLDVLGCAQAGLSHAVAPLGTGFTRDQARLLKRYGNEVVLLFDPDAAGERATHRSAEILLHEDIFVKVVTLPAGQDPDDFIAKNGPNALETLIEEAKDFVDTWLDGLQSTDGKTLPLPQRVREAEGLIRVLRGVPNEILKQEWLGRMSKRLSLEEGALWLELNKEKKSATAAQKKVVTESPKKTAQPKSMIRRSEEELIQLLSAHPDVWNDDLLQENLFIDDKCRQVFLRFQQQRIHGNTLNASAVAGDLPTTEANWFSALLLEEKKFENPQAALQQYVQRLKHLSCKREFESLSREVLQMMEGRLPKDTFKILRYQTLTRELKGAATSP